MGERIAAIWVMRSRVTAIWISFVLLFSFNVIIEVSAPDIIELNIIYVDDEPGEGPGNPPENFTIIQEAIDAANVGDTVFVYNGIYFENIIVNKTINLTGEDKANTIIDMVISGNSVSITGNWVNASGFTVRSNNGDGLTLQNVQNCRIYNNYIHGNDGDGIALYGSNNNSITGNDVQENKRGILVSGSSRNNITGNEFSANDWGILLESSFENIITGNIADVNLRIGIRLVDSNNNSIINNNVSFNGEVGIDLFHSKENTLKDNTMANNGIRLDGGALVHWNTHNIDTSNTVNGKPVRYWKNRTAGKVPEGAGQVILANCTNVSVEGQELTYGTAGIELGFSSNNSITGNNVSSNNVWGIYLKFSHENNISGNVVSFNYEGIIVARSNVNIIIGNMIFSNKERGIILYFYSSANQIIGNMILSNELDGIILYYHSNANQIIGNTIFSNEFNGIGLFDFSSENQIIGNSISFNGGIGLFIDSPVLNNTIYHNNLIDNTIQAVDDTNNGNQWDNGYPSGGNFWSDYNGIDLNSTPSQDVPPPDGIGDTPYVIDSDSQDNYPLMDLIINRTFLYEGWNLISIPFIQSNTNLGVVLDSIKGSYDAVQWYNVTDTSDHWKHNHTLKPNEMNDLNDIDHTIGFWIHVIEPGGILFEYSGVKPIQNQTIIIHPGWNLVGYPSLTNKDRTTALNNIIYGSDVDMIQAFDAATKAWEEIGPTDNFEIGRGYWVHSKVETVWDVPL